MGNEGWPACHFCKSEKKTYACGGCNSVSYCSKDHQRADWQNHLGSCRYYKVVKEPSKPSYVVATRKIPKGTIVIQTEPIVVGPDGMKPVCLGCLRPIIYDVMSYLCEGCGWPMDVQCRNSEAHQLECNAFQMVGFHFDKKELWKDWQKHLFILPGVAIMIVRILVSNQTEKVLKLYREEDNLFNAKIFGIAAANTSSYIRDSLKLQQYDHDTICKLFSAVFHVSMLLPPFIGSYGNVEARSGYAVLNSDAVFIQPSCFPNLNSMSGAVAQPNKIYYIANEDIQRGQRLTVNGSTSIYQSTAQRQYLRQILSLKLCNCIRCTDPTELGLHFGSVKCKKCYALMTPFFGVYSCDQCHFSIRFDEIAPIINPLGNILNVSNKPIELVKFIKTHSGHKGMLHPNHYLIYLAKEKYCDIIDKGSLEKGATYAFDPKDRDRFYKYTQDLIARNAKLNQTGFVEYFRWLGVHSRFIIHQWFVGNITNRRALELINEVVVDHNRMKKPELYDGLTGVLEKNLCIELRQHQHRLLQAEEDYRQQLSLQDF